MLNGKTIPNILKEEQFIFFRDKDKFVKIYNLEYKNNRKILLNSIKQ